MMMMSPFFYVGWLVALLFFMFVFAGVVYAAARLSGSDLLRGKPDDEALRILRARYSRGEIDTEEYDRRRRALLK